jgi:hypothetical protein
MNTRIVHRLTGYDRKTELLAIEYEIPVGDITCVKEIAGVDPSDPNAIGSYPLDQGQVESIARLLGAKINNDMYDFFLEPFEE